MPAALNLMKLCVGADAPEDLRQWQKQRFGGDPAQHVTRMWPKREAELLDGGSLYWVFKGMMLARQTIIGLEERVGDDGIRRCALILAPPLIAVSPVPRRPFQGWRYLAGSDAPPDQVRGKDDEPALPADIATALAELGLR